MKQITLILLSILFIAGCNNCECDSIVYFNGIEYNDNEGLNYGDKVLCLQLVLKNTQSEQPLTIDCNNLIYFFDHKNQKVYIKQHFASNSIHEIPPLKEEKVCLFVAPQQGFSLNDIKEILTSKTLYIDRADQKKQVCYIR